MFECGELGNTKTNKQRLTLMFSAKGIWLYYINQIQQYQYVQFVYEPSFSVFKYLCVL
jgi:hypothetical protein